MAGFALMLFSAFVFAVSASLDAFLTGLAFGLRRQSISIFRNLTISLITLIGTFLTLLAGSCLSHLFPGHLAEKAGGILLILLGLFYLLKFMKLFFKKYPSDKETEEKKATALTPAATLLLSLSLSVNNIGIGIGASIAGICLPAACGFTFLFSVLFLAAGNHLGNAPFLRFADRFADLLCGLLLAGLGLSSLL